MPTAPMPGTRWVARTGKHAGREVEVDHTTDVSVFTWTVAAGQSEDRADPSKRNRIPLETFHGLYRRAKQTNGSGTQTAFRQVNIKKIAPPGEELPPVSQPLEMNGYVLTRDSDLGIAIEEITPDLARAWLDRGGVNRKSSERNITRIAAAIRRGEWLLTGDSIKLDPDGHVLDGKHRLQAIVQAGIPVMCLVVRNVQPAAQDVIDTNRVRTAGDVLSMAGVPSAHSVASASRTLMIVEHLGRLDANSRQVNLLISNASIKRYAESHPEVVDGVRIADRLRINGRLGGGNSLVGAAITWFLRLDAVATVDFCEGLEYGANLDPNSPILRLRNRLLDKDSLPPHSPSGREAILAMIIKAWNAWRKGETMRLLIWRETEGFPKPV